jgi:UDP-3-O-[3-hydroxymyristoyl] N-acetylglucosamine deacetylase/3-hydroxyacyl-[acyl-carrier-protein] dehydratase
MKKEYQNTIGGELEIQGLGLHTGEMVRLRIKPAEVNSGFTFIRTDAKANNRIPATLDNVVSTDRGTSIGNGNVIVHTVEHLLAALAGAKIDNAIIEVTGTEMPILDGSAGIFVNKIKEAGTLTQDSERKYIIPKTKITYHDEATGSELTLLPDEDLSIAVKIDFGTEVLDIQEAYLDSIAEFNDRIATCRTFVFLHELEFLLAHNLIKGGDLNNAIVFVNKPISQEELNRLAKVFDKPEVKVMERGVLNNLKLRYENEPARHKLLDLLGDLTLLGKPIKGKIIAFKPGHKVNYEFGKKIVESLK